MPINFGMLSGINKPQVVANLPSAPQSDGGIGELLSGLQGLVGALSPQPQGQWGTPVDTHPTYGASGLATLGTTEQPSWASPIQPGALPSQGLQNMAQKGVNMSLEPSFSKMLPQVLGELKAMGFQPIIASGKRTTEEQRKLVANGSSKTMKSNHLTGNAVDIIDARYGWDVKKYPNKIKNFASAMTQVAGKYGLSSGTKWKSFGPYGDFAHLQYTPQKAQSNQHNALPATMSGIASVESAGEANPYAAMGKATRTGDRAYGKYQIMGANIPAWSREALGHPITIKQYMDSPQLQEQIAGFQINKYLQQGYSPQDTASMWFTGSPLNKVSGGVKDAYGTTNDQYQKKFNKGFLQYQNGGAAFQGANSALNDQYPVFGAPVGQNPPRPQVAMNSPFFSRDSPESGSWNLPASQMPVIMQDNTTPGMPTPSVIPNGTPDPMRRNSQIAQNGSSAIDWGLLQGILNDNSNKRFTG